MKNFIEVKCPNCKAHFFRTKEQLAEGEICMVCGPINKPGQKVYFEIVNLTKANVKSKPKNRKAKKAKR